MIPILTVIVLCIGRIMLFHVQNWFSTYDDPRCIYLSYKKFESLYNIAPDKYQLYNFEEQGPCVRYWIHSNCSTCYIYFRSYFEWFRAKRLLHAYEKGKINAKRLKRMDEYLNAAKRDLANFNINFNEEKSKSNSGSRLLWVMDKDGMQINISKEKQ